MKFGNIIIPTLFFLLVLVVYRSWILSPVIIGGDWPFFFPEGMSDFSFFPPAWNYVYGNGFGGTMLSYSLATYMYAQSYIFTHLLGIPWEAVSKIFWFYPLFTLSFFTMYFLSILLFPKKYVASGIAGFIYAANTYILMLSAGGQMGIGLAYAIIPLCFATFYSLLQKVVVGERKHYLQKSFVFSLTLSLLAILDVRVGYMFGVAAVIFSLTYLYVLTYHAKEREVELRRVIIYVFLIPLLMCLLLQAFWIIPSAINPPSLSSLGVGEDIAASLSFFSFANFSDALSLLHPNWPDNIFGKVTFLRPEFLIMPILAFVPLALLGRKYQKDWPYRATVLGLSLVALVGVFLAKGAREPFGDIYVFFFDHVPGFVLFRDPTKWYMLIALAYSLLIPVGLGKLGEKFSHNKYILVVFYSVFFFFYCVVLIRPSLTGELRGTFVTKTVPVEYRQLKDLVVKDQQFYRTLWVPKMYRFGFASRQHPLIEAYDFMRAENNNDLLRKIASPDFIKSLQRAGVRYVVIPYDVDGEIFISDRKYDEKMRQKFEDSLDKIKMLKKIRDGRISVYEAPSYDQLFTLSSNGRVRYYPKGDNYAVVVAATRSGSLVFSENYSPFWQGVLEDGSFIRPKRTDQNFMEFSNLPSGLHTIVVQYEGEIYYLLGRIVSISAMVILVLLLIRNRITK